MRTLRRRWLLLVATAATTIAGAACGLPVDNTVEILAQSDHQDLLQGTTSTTTAAVDPNASETTPIVLYFIGPDDKLERVQREFGEPPTGNEVLGALADKPLESEVEMFSGLGTLKTLLPEGLAPRFGDRDVDKGIQQIVVDPAGQLQVLLVEQPVQGRLIVTQIVCTVLSLDLESVTGVEIYEGDTPIPLSDNDAEPILGAATVEDFDNCITGSDERQDLLTEETTGASSSTTTARAAVTTLG